MDPAERYKRDPHFHYLVDVLYRELGGIWWLTDMAEGDKSFRYDP